MHMFRFLGTYSHWSYSILCLRTRKAEGPLSEHTFPQTPNQSVHHLLQLNSTSRTSCQENYRDWILMLLYPFEDGSNSS